MMIGPLSAPACGEAPFEAENGRRGTAIATAALGHALTAGGAEPSVLDDYRKGRRFRRLVH